MTTSTIWQSLKNRVSNTRFLSLLLREWLVLLLVLPVFCVWLSSIYSVKLLDNFVYDRLLAGHIQPVDPRIVIVEIDDKSLAEQGAWPWPRSTHAQLLSRIADAKPRSVLVDLIFAEPARREEDDVLLREALQKIPQVALPVMLIPQGSKSIEQGNTAYTEVLPIDALAQHAALGHIMAQADADNVLRRMDGVIATDKHNWPALSVQASLTQPVVGRTLIPYIAPVGSYPRVSYADVLAGRVPDDVFANRFVLLGAGAAGLGDQYATPFGTMTGVEIQAVMMDALLNERVIRSVDGVWAWVLMVLPIVLLLFGFMGLRERYQLWFFVMVVAGYVAVTAMVLWRFGLWLSPVATTFILLLAYILWSWRRLSAAVRYFDGEIQNVAQSPNQLNALLSHVTPHSIKNVPPRRRSLNALIQQVGDLQHFIMHSLLQAQPTAMLIFDDAGQIILSNQKMIDIVGAVSGSVDALLLRLNVTVPHEGYAHLMGVEVQVSRQLQARVYQLQCHPINMDGMRATWLLSWLDLTDERELQRQSVELIQFLSHDLRTPQVNIMSLLQLHQRDAQAMPVDQMMTQVAQNVERTLTLAENLVMLTHAKTGQYHFVDLNLAQMASFAIEQVWPQAKGKRIQIQYNAPTHIELFWIRADGVLLERALINVLTNAVRYSPANSTVQVVVEVGREGDILCCVIDQGLGMSTAELNNMMNGLPTEHPKNVDAAGSIGVGFSMVRAVMKGHGGQVTVNSAMGKGTVVALHFVAEPKTPL